MARLDGEVVIGKVLQGDALQSNHQMNQLSLMEKKDRKIWATRDTAESVHLNFRSYAALSDTSSSRIQ